VEAGTSRVDFPNFLVVGFADIMIASCGVWELGVRKEKVEVLVW
jgi:hypothetical protein